MVQFLHHFLLGLIRSLKFLEKRLFLVLKFTGDALGPCRLVKSLLDSTRVGIRIVGVGVISTHLGVEFGLELFVLHTFISVLLFTKMLLSIDGNDLCNLLLLVFDLGKCASVTSLEICSLHVNCVFRACTHLIEAATVIVLRRFILHMVSRHHIHFLLLDVVHVLDKFLSTLKVFDPLIGALLFLE